MKSLRQRVEAAAIAVAVVFLLDLVGELEDSLELGAREEVVVMEASAANVAPDKDANAVRYTRAPR